MKLCIFGSRSFTDYRKLCAVLRAFDCKQITEVISGGAIGADKLGERWAFQYGKKLSRYEPNYEAYGRYEAPKRRNDTMADVCDMAAGFWDWRSGGTRDMIQRLANYRKPYLLVRVEPTPRTKQVEMRGI